MKVKKRNVRLVKISAEIHELAFKESLKLSEIEGKKVSIKDVFERPLKDERVRRELELGAKQRRMGIR